MYKKIIISTLFVVSFVLCAYASILVESENHINSFEHIELACIKCASISEMRFANSEVVQGYDSKELNFLEKSGQKSARNAMLMSAVLPGAGQMYLGQKTKAGVFVAAEIAFIFTMLRFDKEKNIAIENYQMLAYANAGLRKGSSTRIYGLAQRYKSSEDYNRYLEMQARNYFIMLYNDPESFNEYMERYSIKSEDSWQWQNDFHFSEYKSVRNDKQNFEIYGNFALGALLINRVISVLDSAIQTRRINRNSQIYAIPENNGRGISLVYEHKF